MSKFNVGDRVITRNWGGDDDGGKYSDLEGVVRGGASLAHCYRVALDNDPDGETFSTLRCLAHELELVK